MAVECRRLDDRNLPSYLTGVGLLERAAGARVERVGEGNLNFVRRVRAPDGGSLVVKQARPHVESFPEMPLTSQRIVFERRYEVVVRELAPEAVSVLPTVLHFDEAARILVMEDVGGDESLQDALRAGRVPERPIRALGDFLAAVHAATAAESGALAEHFRNDEMRRLHGGQLFRPPQATPELIPELRRVIRRELARPEVLACIAELGRDYAGRNEALVHGDVKSANVLLQAERPRLIDAEFAHVGDPAFDLGTALAHLVLCLPPERGPELRRAAERALLEGYGAPAGGAALVARARRYAGVDIVYHVIGAGRLAFLGAPERAEPVLRAGAELLLLSSAGA